MAEYIGQRKERKFRGLGWALIGLVLGVVWALYLAPIQFITVNVMQTASARAPAVIGPIQNLSPMLGKASEEDVQFFSSALARANPRISSKKLKPGMIIKMPPGECPPFHTVEEGEMGYDMISRRHLEMKEAKIRVGIAPCTEDDLMDL